MSAEHPVTIWLRERGRPARWLARQVGVDPALVSRWLRGYRPIPPDVQARLAELTGDDTMPRRIREWQQQ